MRNYLSLSNSAILRFSPNSEETVKIQRGELLDVVNAGTVIMVDNYNNTVADTNDLFVISYQKIILSIFYIRLKVISI